MVRKKQADDHPPESWLMSYCDMITLLVTFFLMELADPTPDRPSTIRSVARSTMVNVNAGLGWP